jgi:hypothetical protein
MKVRRRSAKQKCKQCETDSQKKPSHRSFLAFAVGRRNVARHTCAHGCAVF